MERNQEYTSTDTDPAQGTPVSQVRQSKMLLPPFSLFE